MSRGTSRAETRDGCGRVDEGAVEVWDLVKKMAEQVIKVAEYDKGIWKDREKVVKEEAEEAFKVRHGSGSSREDEVEGEVEDLQGAAPLLILHPLFSPLHDKRLHCFRPAMFEVALANRPPDVPCSCPTVCPLHRPAARQAPPLLSTRQSQVISSNHLSPIPHPLCSFPCSTVRLMHQPLHDKRFCSLRPVLWKVHSPHHSPDVPLFLRFSPPPA